MLGRDNFQKLFEYVCSLEYVHALATDFYDENYDELLFDPAFGNTVHHKMKQALKRALWIEDGKYLQSWFGLPDGKSYGSLKKLRLAVDDDIFAVGNRYSSSLCSSNLVPRAHVPFGQHQDTELWNNQPARSQGPRVFFF